MLNGMELRLDSKFKIHGGQRAHKIVPRDNIGLDFLGQDDQLVILSFITCVLKTFLSIKASRKPVEESKPTWYVNPKQF